MSTDTGNGAERAAGPLPVALEPLLQRFRAGQRLALARAITLVENQRPGFQPFLHGVLARGLRARRIGLTGPPGAGKSTLLAALANAWREQDQEVGIVAVDPTSPFSGGALLGDRIRMNDIAMDSGIFIRSMATRGALGGLATTTEEVVDLMDGFGFPYVLVETVGVGQTELEISAAADTVVVVLVPESGDGIQAMKAGLMEIADIFVVNKADRPGADRLVKELRVAIQLRAGEALRDVPAHHGVDLSRVGEGRERETVQRPAPGGAWRIPVVKTVAQKDEGIPELLEAVAAHRAFLDEAGELARRRRLRAEARVADVVERELRRLATTRMEVDPGIREELDRMASGDGTPYSVARTVLEKLLGEELAGELGW